MRDPISKSEVQNHRAKYPVSTSVPHKLVHTPTSTHTFTVCSYVTSPTPIPQTTKPPGVPRLTNFHMCLKPRVAHMTWLSFPLGSYLPLPSAVCFYNAARRSELKLFSSLSSSTNSSKSPLVITASQTPAASGFWLTSEVRLLQGQV